MAWGVLAANMAKAEKETPKKVVEEKKEETKKETAKEEQTTEPEVTYPKDITLDAEVQNKVTEFLDFLCKMDTSDRGHNLAINHKVIFDYLFKSSYMPV